MHLRIPCNCTWRARLHQLLNKFQIILAASEYPHELFLADRIARRACRCRLLLRWLTILIVPVLCWTILWLTIVSIGPRLELVLVEQIAMAHITACFHLRLRADLRRLVFFKLSCACWPISQAHYLRRFRRRGRIRIQILFPCKVLVTVLM